MGGKNTQNVPESLLMMNTIHLRAVNNHFSVITLIFFHCSRETAGPTDKFGSDMFGSGWETHCLEKTKNKEKQNEEHKMQKKNLFSNYIQLNIKKILMPCTFKVRK